MDMQYKPTKPKKEKPVNKTPKAPKAEKAMKFNSTVQTVKSSKPAKAPKAPKAPKPEKAKAISFGRPGKVQTEKPMKVERANKKPNFLSKLDPKVILGIVLGIVVVAAVIVLTVVLPAIQEHGQQINNITVSTLPEKTIYLIGEEVNYDGMRVRVTRNNGETFTVRANKCELTGFDSEAAGAKTITVEYQGFIATFSVNVQEPPKPTPVLKGIKLVEMPKTEYKTGEWLDTNGGVILCEYVDGSEYRVSLVNSYIFGWEDVKGPGKYTLTVKYIENGIIAETTYDITVTG